MVNFLKWLLVGGLFIKGIGYVIVDFEIIDIWVGENYIKNCWSIGGVIMIILFSFCFEYLVGKDGGVKSDGFYVIGCYWMLCNFDFVVLYDYFNVNKVVSRKQINYIVGL